MPLQPAERAALAFWLIAARQLDPDCCFLEDQPSLSLLQAARSRLRDGAESAGLYVRSTAEIGGHIARVADALRDVQSITASPSAPEVVAAEALLRQLAMGIQEAGDGDGPALNIADYHPCACGVLVLAGLIEARVREIIGCGGAGRRQMPDVRYVTAFAEDAQELAPFRLNGEADIRHLPRTVTLVLRPEEMTSRDLWHLAYTLHHELVCHAFQGAFSGGRLPNAHASCHWTEGWMDTVAHDLVLDWLRRNEAPPEWLPLRGDAAVAELWRFHEHRYLQPRGLKGSQVKLRQRARAAYRALVVTLFSCGIAASEEEAERLARRFSLAANTHSDANCGRLLPIASKLRIALLNVARPEMGVEAARVCLTFIADDRFDDLEQALLLMVPD